MNEHLWKLCVLARIGFPLLAVEFSHECWCGNSHSDALMISERRCNLTCSGDSSKTCGGSNAMEIYNTVPRGETCVWLLITYDNSFG